jgi:hypothetical protein
MTAKSKQTKKNSQPARAKGGLIAVPDYKSDLLTGAIIWWHLTGAVNSERLRQEWQARGLDAKLFPDLPTPGYALHHTAKKLSEQRRLARPLEGKKGWALVHEHADGDGLDYDMGCRMKLDANDDVVVDPPDHALAKEIKATFERLLREYDHHLIGRWLRDMSRAHRAVCLRETGGVFFVPRDQVESIKRYFAALHTASACRVYEVPAMRSEEAVEAVMDAVAREAEQEAAEMEKALSEMELGERALQGRAARCQQMIEHVESYEELLGRGLDKLKKRIEDLKANAVAAALSAAAEDEKAA